MIKNKYFQIIFCLIILIIILSSCKSIIIPDIPDLTGEYKVGISTFQLEDKNRIEEFSSNINEKRKISVKVWYPAVENAQGNYEPFLDKITGYAMNKYFFFVPSSSKIILSRSLIDAPISVKKSKFPLIIFNHGLSSFEKQNSIQFEELASNGYVVMSINHPYDSLITVFDDGSKIERTETEFYKNINEIIKKGRIKKIICTLLENINKLNRASTSEEQIENLFIIGNNEPFKYTKKTLDRFYMDSLFLINSVKNNNLPLFLQNKIDADKIGFYGHSFGGLISMKIGLMDNPTVKAIINMDGPFFMYEKNQEYKLKIPAMIFASDGFKFFGYSLSFKNLNDLYFNSSEKPVYKILYKNSAHFNYSDLTYSPILKITGLIGSIDGKMMGITQTEYILAFFNKYLKDIDSNILKDNNPKMEEIKFYQRNTD